MSINVSADNLTIFKFEETGVVALCQEVVEYIGSGHHIVDKIDLASARYERGKFNEHQIVFDYKE